MLLEFRVKNFKSFRNEIVFSMISAKNSESSPESIAAVGHLNVLKIAAVYGANASGKSNLIKAVETMRRIVVNSATEREPGSRLGVVPFEFDDAAAKEPALFEVVFIEQGQKYQYGFTANDYQIFEEWLYVVPEGKVRYQTWFERGYNRLDKKVEINCTNYLGGKKNDLAEKVRLDTAFVSVGAQWNNTDLTTVYRWFREKLIVIDENIEISSSLTGRSLSKETSGEFYRFTRDMLRTADLGISDVFCAEINPDKIRFPKDTPDDVRDLILKNPPVDIKFRHTMKGKEYSLDFEDESQGTQKMFAYMKPLWDISRSDSTFLIDEFDRSLHPLILEAIMNYICSAKNRSGQLIITAHDTNLQAKLSREQIWFAQKDSDGESTIFSLADYKGVRKDENKADRYLSGHYGAVPYIEEF